MGAEGRGATASGVSVRGAGAGTSSCRPIPSRCGGLMNKQQSEAPSPWRPRQWREPPPLQGPPRGCRALAPPLSALCSAEGAQVSTGPAPATPAAAAADGVPGQRRSRIPGGAGSPRERCSPGSAAVRGAPGVLPEPPPARGVPERGARWQLRARGARRAGLGGLAVLLAKAQPPGSAPTSGPLCSGACRVGCLCVGWLASLPPIPISQRR